ncbi:MAG: hypothetical protein AAFV95_21795 [Bacteroidota bacterium]
MMVHKGIRIAQRPFGFIENKLGTFQIIQMVAMNLMVQSAEDIEFFLLTPKRTTKQQQTKYSDEFQNGFAIHLSIFFEKLRCEWHDVGMNQAFADLIGH